MSQIDQPGNPRFLALLDEMRALHLRKAADYGTNADPLANIRAATEFGDNPAKAVAVRLGDKISRLKAWSRSGKLANEGLRDTFMDVACYGLIGLVMAEEFGDDPKCTIPKPVTDAAATGVKPR